LDVGFSNREGNLECNISKKILKTPKSTEELASIFIMLEQGSLAPVFFDKLVALQGKDFSEKVLAQVQLYKMTMESFDADWLKPIVPVYFGNEKDSTE
jgi:hypothetical protein